MTERCTLTNSSGRQCLLDSHVSTPCKFAVHPDDPLSERDRDKLRSREIHDGMEREEAARAAREAIICKRCGYPLREHVLCGDDEGRAVARLCPTSTFKATE